jgi:hypothetical protein
VADVLRAALSEIETYDRVDVKELEPVEVRGASVSDLAHLLAELLENATAFSPPQTRVRVLGRVDSDGYTVVVVDEGIGMSSAELESANQLINNPDESGFLSDSRMLGLGVVGRLAARHGFKVNLTASPVGGVVAWVTLPTSALAPRRGGAEPEPGPGITTAALLGTADAPAAPAEGVPGTAPAGTGERAGSGADTERGTWPNARPATAAPSGALPLRGPVSEPPAAAPENPAATQPGVERTGVPAARQASTDAEQAPAVPTTRVAPDAPTAPSGPATPDAPPATPGTPSATPETPAATAVEAASDGPGRTRPGAAGGPGSFPLPPRAPEVAASPNTGAVIIPPAPEVAPVSGPIAFRKPTPGPGEPTTLTRRIRGAQLPDTGEGSSPSAPETTNRPARSAQSVRGALQSFNAGRRTASEVTLGATKPVTGLPLEQAASTSPITATTASTSTTATPDAAPVTAPNPIAAAASAPTPAQTPTSAQTPAPVQSAAPGKADHRKAPTGQAPASTAAPADPPATVAGGRPLPRRVRGAQMPETDLPTSAPPPGRSAAEVRAALSNFVAGRRAAENED